MMVMERKVIYLGYIEHGTGQHQSNTVTSVNGVSPALTTLQGGTQQVKILVSEDGYRNENSQTYRWYG